MNTKFLAGLTVAAAAVAVSGFSSPAHAIGFGNSGISFDKDTQVEFNFLESHGAYVSSLGIYEVAGSTTNLVKALFSEKFPGYDTTSGDFTGTFGNTVTSSTGINSVVYTFKAGVNYALGLSSVFGGASQGTVFSSDALNNPVAQQAIFSGDLSSSSKVWFDDRGNNNDKDFNDFGVSAKAVPEPLTMSGIALAGAGMAYARRRRAQA